jgi:hypothetical protein
MVSIEARRKMSASKLGKPLCDSARAKLKGNNNRQFPARCIKCVNRDANVCACYNMSCTKARETECFKRLGRRKEHPEYKQVKGGK